VTGSGRLYLTTHDSGVPHRTTGFPALTDLEVGVLRHQPPPPSRNPEQEVIGGP
jgi:hypothetical protein